MLIQNQIVSKIKSIQEVDHVSNLREQLGTFLTTLDTSTVEEAVEKY
jgi:hypothetical protein